MKLLMLSKFADYTGSNSEGKVGDDRKKGIIGKMHKFDWKLNTCFREKRRFPKLIFFYLYTIIL